MAGLTLYEKLDQIEQPLRGNDRGAFFAGNPERFGELPEARAEALGAFRDGREIPRVEAIDKGLTEAKQMVLEADDPEMKQLAEEEEKQLAARKETVERELKFCCCRRTRTTRKT
jgi:protein subunit release factor A